MLWYHFNPKANEEYNSFWHVWRIIGFILSFLNSCLNPIVLCCISGVFRSHFRRYILSSCFCCCYCCFWCCCNQYNLNHFHPTTSSTRSREASITTPGFRSINSIDLKVRQINSFLVLVSHLFLPFSESFSLDPLSSRVERIQKM